MSSWQAFHPVEFQWPKRKIASLQTRRAILQCPISSAKPFHTTTRKSKPETHKSFQNLQAGSNPHTNTFSRAKEAKTTPPILKSWKSRLLLLSQNMWEGSSTICGSWAEVLPFSAAHLHLPHPLALEKWHSSAPHSWSRKIQFSQYCWKALSGTEHS